jgi:hypothetical protein
MDKTSSAHDGIQLRIITKDCLLPDASGSWSCTTVVSSSTSAAPTAQRLRRWMSADAKRGNHFAGQVIVSTFGRTYGTIIAVRE